MTAGAATARPRRKSLTSKTPKVRSDSTERFRSTIAAPEKFQPRFAQHLDFDAGAHGQAGDLDGGAGGIGLGHVLLVDRVHGRELFEIEHEDGRFHDVGVGEAGGVEQRLDVLEDLLGLGVDAAVDEFAG